MCSSSLCVFRHSSLYCVAVVVPFLFFIVFSSSSLFSLLLSLTVLILSTFFVFKFTKRKPSFEENINNLVIKDEVFISTNQSNKSELEEPELENEILEPIKKVTQLGMAHIHDCLLAKSSDISSETESCDLSSNSEDSDIDWSFRYNVGQTPIFSDDSISDDDSLIEIELPGGHYIGSKGEPNFSSGTKEEPNFNFCAKGETKFMEFQNNLPKLFQESIFGQEDLMELLTDINEMNEEENLIEIDISIGSIKCSSLEITA